MNYTVLLPLCKVFLLRNLMNRELMMHIHCYAVGIGMLKLRSLLQVGCGALVQ